MPESNSEQLTAKQEKTLSLLLSEPTIGGAAIKAGLTERTIYNWLNEPTFKKAYRDICRASVQNAIAQLQNASGTALAVLIAIMSDTNQRASTRLTAAKTVLESSLKAFELEDLAQRVEALEAMLEERKK